MQRPAVPTPRILRFALFELDLQEHELRKAGVRIKLQEQPYQVLAMLLERPAQIVTRDDLRQRLWPADTFVDFDHGLNTAIKRLREALGEDADNPRFIETLPRRGYRFIAAVDSVRTPGADQQTDEPPTPPLEEAPKPGGGSPQRERIIPGGASRYRVLIASLLVGLAVSMFGAGIYLLRTRGSKSRWNLESMKISRVTQSGNATAAAISPDGRYVAYALREGEKQSLNIRQVATGSDVQILPPDQIVLWGLIFSPDGNYIDFVRSEKNNPFNTYLYRMPVLGGTPYLVMKGGLDGSHSYSPDGTQFAFLRVRPKGGDVDLLIANADGSSERLLATRPYLDEFSGTAWSPDGKTVAFTTLEATIRLRSVLWATSVADGSVREIYSTADTMGRPHWLPDGSGLLVSIGPVFHASPGQLWSISFPGGEIHRLTNDLNDYQDCCLDLTQDGRTLVDTASTTVTDLWLAPAGDAARAKQILLKEPQITSFSWMPNGRIVFANGEGNLFSLDPAGSGHTLLTPNEHPNWFPSVCGDGRYIVYAAYRQEKLGIWRMDADGSNSVRIADETVAISPQCSPDGKSVFFLRGPTWIPVRVPITGSQLPEVLTQVPASGASLSAVSPNGKLIAYLAFSDSLDNAPPSASKPLRLVAIPFEGGTPLYQFDWPPTAGDPRWAPGGAAIEYVLTRNGVSNIWEQQLTGGPPKRITNFESGLIFDFSWSPDGRQLALTRGSQSSDVIMIRNQ